MNGLVAIVDAYGPAKQVLPFFMKKDYGCIHVQGTPEALPGLTRFREEDYLASTVHSGDVERTVHQLSEIARRLSSTIACVIPGIETGVDLADRLSEAMGLPTNGTALGRVRRDKYLMTNRLREQGVAAVQHFKSHDVGAILDWVAAHTSWPVVIKPLDSGGTDGVFVCRSQEEVIAAFASLIGKTNFCGSINHEVLVQAFLRGDEYVVNSVSHDGKHYVSDMWYGRKRFLPGHGFIYDREELLPFSGEIQTQLIGYTHRVLDALGIKFGPTHAEIMMTADGPILIEVGARTGGAVNPAMIDECVGHNQFELAADAYVDSAAFLSTLSKPYAFNKYGMLVVLASDRQGTLRSLSFVDELKKLPCVRNVIMRLAVGGQVKKTVDLWTSPGHLHLVNESREALERDYEMIQKIVREALADSVDEQDDAARANEA